MAAGFTLTVCVCVGVHICFAELTSCPACPGLSIHPLIEHRFPAAQSSVESPWTGRKRKSLWLERDGYSIVCVRTEPCAFLRLSAVPARCNSWWFTAAHLTSDQDNKIAALHKDKQCCTDSNIYTILSEWPFVSRMILLRLVCFKRQPEHRTKIVYHTKVNMPLNQTLTFISITMNCLPILFEAHKQYIGQY